HGGHLRSRPDPRHGPGPGGRRLSPAPAGAGRRRGGAPAGAVGGRGLRGHRWRPGAADPGAGPAQRAPGLWGDLGADRPAPGRGEHQPAGGLGGRRRAGVPPTDLWRHPDVGGPLGPAGSDHHRTSGEFQSVEEIAALPIPTATGGQVALRDLARVEDTFADVTEITRLNGNPSVGLSIQKEAQANTVEVARRVRAEIERIEADLGPGYRLLTVFDQAEFIELSIQQLVENALVGAVLAGLVLLLFLRNLRATLVVV